MLTTHAQIVARSSSFALVRSVAGVFAVDDTRGVRGPLQLPERAVWVGIAAQRVLAAEPGGELFAAPDLQHAARGAFKRIAQVPGASLWDASMGFVATTAADEAFVSADAGASFRRATPRPNAILTDLAVRSDGVVAVIAAVPGGDREPFVSRDAGRHWARAAVEVDGLARVGGWIFTGQKECPVVLGADGVRWRDDLPGDALWRREWEAGALAVSQSYTAHPRLPMISPSDPAPPRAPRGSARMVTARSCDYETRFRPLPSEASDGCGPGPLGCLKGSVGPAAPPGEVRIAFFQDAACAPEDADRDDPVKCREGAPLVHLPTAAVVAQRGSLRPVPLPADCEPEARQGLTAAGGVTVLLCKGEGRRALYLGDAAGEWHREGELLAGAGAPVAALAADGTLLLRVACSGLNRCENSAWYLRTPRPLGDERAWKRLDVQGATAYRSLVGGRALAIIDDDDPEGMISLTMVEVDGTSRRVATRVPTSGRLTSLEVEDDRVIARRPRSAGKDETLVLSQDGTFKAL
jgi:hypothetical protein